MKLNVVKCLYCKTLAKFGRFFGHVIGIKVLNPIPNKIYATVYKRYKDKNNQNQGVNDNSQNQRIFTFTVINNKLIKKQHELP